MASEKPSNKTGDSSNVLVAGVIYLLMNKSYHISRNVRAQWFLQHLNTTITLHPSKNVGDSDCELAVVSILPQDCPDDWTVDSRHLYHYLVTTNTNVIFFSEIYSTVYCLDMSPSISAVDIQHGKVMLDEIVDVLDESLSGVVSTLIIPGSEIMFEPQIFVTVIVHTPFFTTPAQQVLVQGWQVTQDNLAEFLAAIRKQLQLLEDTIAEVSALFLSPRIVQVLVQGWQVTQDNLAEFLAAIRKQLQLLEDTIAEVSALFLSPRIVQVLVQGWQVTQDNLAEFLAAIRKQLQLLEDTIAEVSALAYDQLEALRIRQMESDRLVGGLFEEASERVQMSTAEIPMVSPDSGFINLLRYGMLALRLLPHSSLSNLVVVTDGVISLPDIHVLDLVLTQLRTNAVAVSFLHVGSQFHPHCAQGLVPYSELMQFISCATFGTYIPYCGPQNYGHEGLNMYHEAFLTWSFKKGANVHSELSTPVPRMGEWFVSNHSFYGNREPQLLMKKQTEDNLNASLASVLCCRLHEGFMIKNISVKESQLEVCLMLPWANHIYLEYIVICEWPVPPHSSVRFYISIKAPYEFLHDITCLIKKQFQSPYRQAVVTRFWTTIKTLAQSDLLLAHLDSFSTTPLSSTLPETIRSGMPLFYLPSNSGPHTLSSSDPSCPQFAHFWRPVCLLDPSVWHKWMHTQTLSLIMQHDLPLPRYLHVASPNGRFQGLQCRHAAATLYNFLKDWTSFVLIENHSYLKFLSSGESDKTPSWFYVIRVQQKPPCAVIHIAFLGGTPGKLRHQIIEQLKTKISALTIPQRLTTKHQDNNTRNQGEGFVDNQTRSNVPCCILLNKPLEKILIRYERMPSEFGTVVFPDGTQPQTAVRPPRPTSTLVTTLSRYLHHRRWVWSVSPSSQHVLHVSSILSLLTQMRLQEGFRFAHSTAGIINLVLEIQMKCCDLEADHMCDNYQPCIIQYVLFPLHVTSNVGKGRIDACLVMEKDIKDGGFCCEQCGKVYSYKYNLNAHLKKKHGSSLTTNEDFTFEDGGHFLCDLCPSMFKKKCHLLAHQRQKHNILSRNSISCPFSSCEEIASSKADLNQHFQTDHCIDLNTIVLEFVSIDDFLKWKEEEEAGSKAKFVKETGSYVNASGKCHVFKCHRSGFFTPKGTNKRNLKTQGSCKINGYCPAKMTLIEKSDGTCVLNYTKTHVGHDDLLGHLTLSESERRNLAEKIASKIPFDEILDSVRSSISGKCERLHILSRKDLFNIEKEFNLSSSGIRHENDAISVEFWVEEVKNSDDPCIKLYKPQGVSEESLGEDDFCLIIMNDAQKDMLRKFGKEKITVDGTHGIGNYGFQLITLMTIDDLNQGFPVAFMITNKVSYSTLRLFFNTIKNEAGMIPTNVFMSDMEEAFYTAWAEVMGKPNKRLFCSWHVDRAWRKNIKSKVKSSSKQAELYKMLRVLLLERDEDVFCRLKEQFLQLLHEDEELQDFYAYFEEYYSPRAENWAYCYRKKSGINTNMHLERMHRTLKHIYFQGKNIKRLDKALCALMKLIRDRIFDRLIVLQKGKLTSKLKLLRERHKTAQKLDTSSVMECDEGWLVPSSSEKVELYLVSRNREECNCKLVCNECNSCIHRFSCTCIDSAIRGNMCKHIHLVNSFLSATLGQDQGGPSSVMEIDEDLPVENGSIFVEQLSRSTICSIEQNSEFINKSLDNNKKKFLCSVEKLVSQVETSEEMSVLWKMLKKSEIQINAMKTIKKTETHQESMNSKCSKEPANKKLAHQRPYFKAKEKKKLQLKNKLFANPTPIEHVQMTEVLSNFQSPSQLVYTLSKPGDEEVIPGFDDIFGTENNC